MVSAGRRPARAASFASGTVKVAAPITCVTVARPAHPVDPVMSLTRSAPIVRPAPTPSEPMTCVADKTVTMRFWTSIEADSRAPVTKW